MTPRGQRYGNEPNGLQAADTKSFLARVVKERKKDLTFERKKEKGVKGKKKNAENETLPWSCK